MLLYPSRPTMEKQHPGLQPANGPDKFFQTRSATTNSIDITGGSEKSTFRLGYTNLYQTGVLPNSLLNKNNVTFNGYLQYPQEP